MTPACSHFRPRPGAVALEHYVFFAGSNSLSTFIHSLCVKIPTTPFDCTIPLLLGPKVT